MDNKLYVSKFNKGISLEKLELEIEKVFLKSTNNLEWLSKGDKVLLKPALNSFYSYPATTSPLAIKVLKRVIESYGGIVIIADQSGIEHVLVNEKGILKGSSLDCYVKSKMGTLDDSFIALEKRGWNSYRKVSSKSWDSGFYITDLIDQVDHIINIPRVSSHIQAGVTLGFKNMVGLIREDSRVCFHKDGPFSNAIVNIAKKGSVNTSYINENLFFEKIVEISLAVKDKHRLTLFVADKIQLTIGPDKKIRIFKSLQISPLNGFVFASSNQVATEIFAIDLLISEYKKLNWVYKLSDNFLKIFNNKVVRLDKSKALDNPFVLSAIKLGLGSFDYETIYLK